MADATARSLQYEYKAVSEYLARNSSLFKIARVQFFTHFQSQQSCILDSLLGTLHGLQFSVLQCLQYVFDGYHQLGTRSRLYEGWVARSAWPCLEKCISLPVRACLPGKRDEFLLCFIYEKISSSLPGQFFVLTVVKNSLQAVSLNFHPGNRASPLVSVYMEKFLSR